MYGLMFRTERLDMTRPSLHEAANAAFAGIAGRDRQPSAARQFPSAERCRSIRPRPSSRAWSLVHGFTMLLLDGRLTDILERLPAGTDAETLFGAMLMSMARPRAEANDRR